MAPLANFRVFVEHQRKRAQRLFTQPPHGFTQGEASADYPFDRYYRRLRYWGPNTMLRAYVSHADGEVRLFLEHERGNTPLCTTRDLAEVENVLTTSRFRLRFPRTG